MIVLIGSLFLILALGLITIASIIPALFLSQVFFILLGLALATLVYYYLDWVLIRSLAWPAYVFSIVLLLLTLLFAPSVRGSHRWLQLGSLSLQASEIVKPLLIIFFANFLSRYSLKDLKNLIRYFLLVSLPAALIFFQPDLGSTLIILVLGIGLAFVTGLKKSHLLTALALTLVLIPLGSSQLKSYQKERLTSFINPYTDPSGAGYNVIQSTIAIGSGRLWGKGIRQGIQSQLHFLPERHTDFIFASFAEEFGLLGVSLLLVAYTSLILFVLRLGQKLKDTFSFNVASGIFLILTFSVLVNVCVNLGLLPVTGITLPFFSYGGNSIVIHLMLIGFVLSLDRQAGHL